MIEILCDCSGALIFQGDIGDGVEEWKCGECHTIFSMHRQTELTEDE